ncbi:hypothetical protein SI65_01998 [Aspergillus cristatus]|uniref:Uncharacterized protein n=1 Tax=Aspergillus cristatus TaxID=573508 RepID=A0A1E3BTX4_ASPCR|nr:hypothetical protein SI65_01884 [Aspergillus cristatus]ODM24408.1 hypothetical protein SI65_01998 [Aspergillus cristatus]
MGRQAYLNRLALGRSPYEPPEHAPSPPNESTAGQRESSIHADGYVQRYDDRGHPVNPESKALGKELRKAKNDILSTMGIVVSGEDGGDGAPNEQQKINMIAAENDYGLVMATLDQVSVFLGSWWTSSLTGRIQTFKSYTHVPLMHIINYERDSIGVAGFYFAGIPAWTVSTCLSICRHHPLERLIAFLQSHLTQYSPNEFCTKIIRASFTTVHYATRGALLVLAVQTYMYSLLQSLHLVHPYCMPSASFFVPFGELAPTQLLFLPANLSFGSLANLFLGILKTPSLLVYLYVYLRPIIEIRLYRLIRRRLPKPSLADELSIRVAFENDLIDWMVPTLGRRSEEENRRGSLTLYEDIKYELSVLRNWALSWFGFKRSQAPSRPGNASQGEERIESLRQCIEELQNELGAAQTRTNQTRERPQPLAERTPGHGGAWPSSTAPNLSVQTSGPGSSFHGDRILQNEDNRVSQSPDAMSTDIFSDMPPLEGANAASNEDETHQITDAELPRDQDENRRFSRSNTLFSRPSSPETSPPTSPRVRASLIHQNSDIITMQLELLGNRNAHGQGQANLRPRNAILGEAPADRRSVTEFLDSLLSNTDQNLATIVNDAVDSDGLSNVTAGASQILPDAPSAPTSQDQPAEADSGLANILPDNNEVQTLEEALNDPLGPEYDDENRSNPELPPPAPNAHPRQLTRPPGSPAHRVTILSSHPVDSLASHLASMLTTVIFLPLESLYLRSLASSFLSSRGSSSALRSDVRALGAWGGGGSRTDILTYVGKMALMMSMQAAVNASVWGVISGAAIRIGKKFCGWGSL